MKRRTFITATCSALAVGAASATSPQDRLHTGAALAFGTTIGIAVLHDDAWIAQAAIADGLRAAQRIDRLMSIYHPASQVFRLNRDGVLADPDPQLLTVLEAARRLSVLTDGAFDVTVQPLWTAFNAAATRHALPDERQRRHAQSLVDWRRLFIGSKQVRLARRGMAITLNGLAQGYAADVALAAVGRHGIRHALLDTGEFIARGRKADARPWMLGVRDPRNADALAATLRIEGGSLATSGDYETAFTPDYRHHHIFDPALGDSSPELASVSVTAPTGLMADGLSTAFMAMGHERAQALAARLPEIGLLCIDKQGKTSRAGTFPPQA